MAVNRGRILVAQMARVFLAPVGTPAPTDPVVAPDPAWVEVGYFTPDSLAFNTDLEIEEIRSHQSDYPTRRFQTEASGTVEVDLQEWSGDNLLAVFGGGQITEVPADPASTPPVVLHYRFSPPPIGGRTQTACMLEVIDGSKHYRTIIPVCEQNEGAEISMEKTSESTLPLRLAVVGSDIGDPWWLMSDDPALAPAA